MAPVSRGQLAATCIYTMRHSDDLARCARSGGAGEFQERRAWVTGSALFTASVAAGETMPILFSAADNDSGLIYWAHLDRVEVEANDDDGNGSTTYTFSDLAAIAPARPLSALRLRRTGKPLSDNYIRPYAICQTPSFL